MFYFNCDEYRPGFLSAAIVGHDRKHVIVRHTIVEWLRVPYHTWKSKSLFEEKREVQYGTKCHYHLNWVIKLRHFNRKDTLVAWHYLDNAVFQTLIQFWFWAKAKNQMLSIYSSHESAEIPFSCYNLKYPWGTTESLLLCTKVKCVTW